MTIACFPAAGCSIAMRDRATVWTEQGFEAAELQWEEHYRETLADCRNKYPPRTAEAEACFGPTYDADEHVETAVRSAVALLRTYWTARAAGEKNPSWEETQAQVLQIVGDLPPQARQYFERIKGLK
ncbi:MAG: hypothetical protein VYA51_12740 [Planctomycetota bacterium]|nr:hypothetical protein [Planctomycetota bacterium]